MRLVALLFVKVFHNIAPGPMALLICPLRNDIGQGLPDIPLNLCTILIALASKASRKDICQLGLQAGACVLLACHNQRRLAHKLSEIVTVMRNVTFLIAADSQCMKQGGTDRIDITKISCKVFVR